MSDINKLLEDVNDACIEIWDGVSFVNNKTNNKVEQRVLDDAIIGISDALDTKADSEDLDLLTDRVRDVEDDIFITSEDIYSLRCEVDKKEDVENKVNELGTSTDFYPTQNLLNVINTQIAENLQNISDLVPYISQTTGQSTTDVMSQKAITDLIENIASGGSGFNDKGSVATANDLPASANDFDVYLVLDTNELWFWFAGEFRVWNRNIDLSQYATNTQVESSIKDVTGDLVNLNTTDKTSLVGGINENKSRIDNNAISINDLNLTLQSKANTSDLGLLQTQINTKANQTALDTTNNNVANLQNNITNIKQFNTYEAADDATALAYSIANPNIFVYVAE